MGRQLQKQQKHQQEESIEQNQQQSAEARPKRRATNAHVFRYLQTRNPSRLEENDLKRALEASLEECPDFWPEDSASCSSSEQGNPTSSSASSTSSLCSRNSISGCLKSKFAGPNKGRRGKSKHANHLGYHSHQSSPNHHNHCQHHSQNHANSSTSLTANHQCCCQLSTVHNRYKPVAKKNIYNEADFFHDGIMEYIEFELKALKGKR